MIAAAAAVAAIIARSQPSPSDAFPNIASPPPNISAPTRPCVRRYTNRAFLEAVHWQSAPFKAFQAGTRAEGDGLKFLRKEKFEYTEADVGFM